MLRIISILRFKAEFMITFLIGINSLSLCAQSLDDKVETQKNFKNSLKFNVSNMLLYDNSYQFSYERIIKENQSINVVVGYQEFPTLSILDFNSVNFKKDSDRKGYSAGLDYRFYLGTVNKYSAPRGVYLAPFVSYFQFKTDSDFEYTNPDTGNMSSGILISKLNLINFGGELGYQFILWNRFVIDCVLFGPSITKYNFNVKTNESIPGLEENDLAQKVIEAMRAKFPNIGNITGDEGVSKEGIQSITAIGFRYNISIGYRF